jgi:hypothetical protein
VTLRDARDPGSPWTAGVSEIQTSPLGNVSMPTLRRSLGQKRATLCASALSISPQRLPLRT